MKSLLISFLFILLAITAKSQTTEQEKSSDFGKYHLLKFGPGFSTVPSGFFVGYETTLAGQFSIQATFKSSNGNIADSVAINEIAPHWRIELQPRLYMLHQVNGLYVSGLLNYYDDNSIGFGGGFGYQRHIARRITVDIGAMVQNNNSIENRDAPLFYRANVGIGIILPKYDY